MFNFSFTFCAVWILNTESFCFQWIIQISVTFAYLKMISFQGEKENTAQTVTRRTPCHLSRTSPAFLPVTQLTVWFRQACPTPAFHGSPRAMSTRSGPHPLALASSLVSTLSGFPWPFRGWIRWCSGRWRQLACGSGCRKTKQEFTVGAVGIQKCVLKSWSYTTPPTETAVWYLLPYFFFFNF